MNSVPIPSRKPVPPASDDTAGRDPPSDDGETTTGTPKGWHESSLDLQTGLDTFESDWPDDVTIPGALDP